MKKIYTYIFFASIFLSSIRLNAQEDELGAWYIYNGFFKFTPKVEVFFEFQWRNHEVFSTPETFFFRPYFTYNVLSQLQFGVSAEYHKQFIYQLGGDYQTYHEEFRIDLQAILSQKVGRTSLQHRYRYEFRNVNSDGGNRVRYRFQATIPLTKKEHPKGTFFINTNDEIFITTNPELYFDQNRLYAALGYYFTDRLNFQFGYMLVTKKDGNSGKLVFFLTQKLDFSKE